MPPRAAITGATAGSLSSPRLPVSSEAGGRAGGESSTLFPFLPPPRIALRPIPATLRSLLPGHTEMRGLEIFSLKGRVALVTGSSKGLGWAMAQALAGAGAHVVLNSRDPDALAARQTELAAAGHNASSA